MVVVHTPLAGGLNRRFEVSSFLRLCRFVSVCSLVSTWPDSGTSSDGGPVFSDHPSQFKDHPETSDQDGVAPVPKASPDGEAGFSLVEMMVAFLILAIVMTSLAPAYYGTLKAAAISSQRSQATALAVSATEQLRALPYDDIGFHTTPSACAGSNPVTLSSRGPLDSLPTSESEGTTTYTTLRCVYWVDSSIPGDTDAYKQTQVQVSWTSSIGSQSVTQTSALYPGGQAPYSSGATTTTTTTPLGTPNGPLACTAAPDSSNPSAYLDVGWTVPVGVNPSYYVVYYSTVDPNGGTISSGNNPYTTSANVIGTSVGLTVGSSTTYYLQVESFSASGQSSAPSPTCSATTSGPGGTSSTTTPTTTTTVPPGGGSSTYTSAASAQAINLNLGAGTVSYQDSSTPTQATNGGSGSNSPVSSQPTVSIPAADTFFSAGPARETAEANTDGSSYACAGVLSGGGSMSGGSSTGPCTTTGNSSGGVMLNLEGLPGVSSVVGSLIGGISLHFDAATSWATGNAGGTTFSGDAYLVNPTVTVTTLLGVQVTVSLGLGQPLTSPTDLVSAIATAMAGNATLATLASPVKTALASAVTVTGDYQSQSGGVFTATALHVQLLKQTGTADLASSTVGPNVVIPPTTTTTTTTTTTSTTTTTIAPCSINSLVVNPSQGKNAKGVALTALGTLADESDFSLSVNVNSNCSNVTVGYAPSGCEPGAVSCSTQYAAVTGGSGTLYGTAGTGTTLWHVGTVTFTVFTGSPAAQYSPLTQQQVILCTENGKSGSC